MQSHQDIYSSVMGVAGLSDFPSDYFLRSSSFAITTCLLRKFRPWKVSALVLMFHGIALEDGERYLTSDYELEVKAKSIQFRLVQSKEGLSLKRIQDRFDDDCLPGGKGITHKRH